MSTRKLPALFAALTLLALVAVLFAPALFQGKILAPLDITTTLLQPWAKDAGGAKPYNHNPSDAVTQYLPYRMFMEKSLREDGYIGWNPYEMGGYSLAANTMALPGSWPTQLHRWLPFKDAWNYGIIGEFLIAGSGMLVFLRGRNLPWLPCLIGAVAFMFNAQFVVWIYHRWALGSFCWMPWVLWSFGDGFDARPLPRRIFLFPAFIALAFLGGSLQHAAFVFLACGCIAASHFDFRHPLANKKSLLGWSFTLALAFGMAAFSLLPQLQGYLSNIAIGHTRGGIGYPDGPTQIFHHLLLIPARIWPWLAGDPQTLDAWKLLKSDFMELNYLGTIPMLLGFAGIFTPAVPRAAKWLIVVGLLVPLTPLVGPLYHRVELLFILGTAWMSAEMLHHYQKIKKLQSTNINHPLPSPQTESRVSRFTFRISQMWPRLLIAAVSAIGVALLTATLIPSPLCSKLEHTVVSKAVAKSAESQFGADQEWIASRAREWTRRISLIHPRTAWVYGLLLVGTTGLLLATSRKRRGASAGQILILTATTLELGTLFHTWTTFSDPKYLHPPNPSIDAIRTYAGRYRVLQTTPNGGLSDIFAAPNVLASFEIPSVDAYESIQYRSTFSALAKFQASTRLCLAGVGLAIQPEASPIPPGTEDWPVHSIMDGYLLRKNPKVPAPVSVGISRLPTTPDEILVALDDSAPAIPLNVTPNHFVVAIPGGTTWLRISQNWHSGWKWRSPGSSWQSFQNGPDATCWLDTRHLATRSIEVRFFPRPFWLTLTSLASATLTLCLIPLFRHIGVSPSSVEG